MIMEWRVDALEEPSVRERIQLRRMRFQSVVGQARSLSKSELDPD
jgi:hypothetical protein